MYIADTKPAQKVAVIDNNDAFSIAVYSAVWRI
jgi:hypothetical protein